MDIEYIDVNQSFVWSCNNEVYIFPCTLFTTSLPSMSEFIMYIRKRNREKMRKFQYIIEKAGYMVSVYKNNRTVVFKNAYMILCGYPL